MSLRNLLYVAIISGFSVLAVAEFSGQVLLKTPEFEVTTRDFDYYVKNNIPEHRRKSTLGQEGNVKEVYENLYVIKTLAARAENNKAIDMAEVAWMVEHYRDRLLMARQLEIEVAADLEGIDWDALAREEYLANKERYKVQERIDADHILIGLDGRTKEEAKARAEEVLVRLEKGGDFAELAKEYSDDKGSAAKGGKLGFFSRGRMVKPFEDAAFALSETGELSGLVETQYGYHIIRFNERKPEGRLEFDQVKNQIIPAVKKRMEQKIRAEKISDVKTGAVDVGLQVNLELLEEIEKSYATDKEAAEVE